MQVRRITTASGNLLPSAFNIISSVPENFWRHAEHERRHPASAYGTSLRLIEKRWLAVFEGLSTVRHEYLWAGEVKSMAKLTDDYGQLLSKLNEHYDACTSVLRSLCPPLPGKNDPIDGKFLDKAKLPGWKAFRDATKEYKNNHIGFIVNSLKHNQCELCPVHFESIHSFRPGYFLQDVLPGGQLGPNRKLHSGGNTAFSFARDILMHLWWLYKIGDQLSEAIRIATNVIHGHKLLAQPRPDDGKSWVAILEHCTALRPEFFPDELQKPYPRVILNKQSEELTLEFPTTARGFRMEPQAKVVCQLTIDGKHNTNKVPYLGHMP